MNQIVTTAIVLSRTNFGEADRIITLLTPDQGKLRVMAKGVRKVKSKLAAGIELFSVSEISFIRGRGEIQTLTSSRLQQHFGNIVHDTERTMCGYEFIKTLQRITEDNAESEFFDLLKASLKSLDDSLVPLDLIRLCFNMRLLQITGHVPNMETTHERAKLTGDSRFNFDIEKMSFSSHPDGLYEANDIKLLRLCATQDIELVRKIQGLEKHLSDCYALSKTILKSQFHI